MKIKLIEPLIVPESVIMDLAKAFENEGHEFVYMNTKTTDLEELKSRVSDADVLMIANNPLPNEVISSAKQLKMISVAFTGIDHVGQESIKEKGIVLCNAAGYSNDSVAELVVGLSLDLLRNITTGDKTTRLGGTIAGLIGNELKGKVIGIIGTGRIGLKTAKLFQAFGCKVIAFAPREKQAALAIGIEYVGLDTLMQTADIVSLHLPLMESTKGFITKEKLALMKSSALFINCARGPIVDNEALATLLNEGKIRGAGIDVFDMEPPIPQDYPLLHAKNTVLTPHVAYATQESMITRAEITFKNVTEYLKGNPINVMHL
jgi:D-3-phosphoglycerate dehydrogenase